MKSKYGLKYELLNKDNLDIAFKIQKETWVNLPDYDDLYDKATDTKDDNCFFLVYDKENLIGITGVDVFREYPDTIWLDWFTILPEYQNKGYGTKSLKLLKDFFNEYIGLFGEVETVGYGSSDKENENRIRRKKFYEKLGFIFLNYEFDLFKVIYTPCVFLFKNENIEEEQMVKDMFKFYNIVVGEKKVEKNCKLNKL